MITEDTFGYLLGYWGTHPLGASLISSQSSLTCIRPCDLLFFDLELELPALQKNLYPFSLNYNVILHVNNVTLKSISVNSACQQESGPVNAIGEKKMN